MTEVEQTPVCKSLRCLHSCGSKSTHIISREHAKHLKPNARIIVDDRLQIVQRVNRWMGGKPYGAYAVQMRRP
jgi:hypothetical protein